MYYHSQRTPHPTTYPVSVLAPHLESPSLPRSPSLAPTTTYPVSLPTSLPGESPHTTYPVNVLVSFTSSLTPLAPLTSIYPVSLPTAYPVSLPPTTYPVTR